MSSSTLWKSRRKTGPLVTARPSTSRLHNKAMQVLIVGIGALGGTIAARALCAGLPVRLAARNAESANVLRQSGLRVSGIGGEAKSDTIDIAALEDYGKENQFDLILLATKAQAALDVAPYVVDLLTPDGVILP